MKKRTTEVELELEEEEEEEEDIEVEGEQEDQDDLQDDAEQQNIDDVKPTDVLLSKVDELDEPNQLKEIVGHIESQGVHLDKQEIFNNILLKKDLIKTRKHTIISKTCFIKNPSNILAAKIVISGKCIVRSDLCTIKIDLYTSICDSVILKPPMTKKCKFIAITIGKYTIIGQNSVIKASIIGNCTRIGKNCILEDNVVVGNNTIILDDSIVPEDTMIPDNCIFGGRPAKFIKRSPVNTAQNHMIEAIYYYESVLSNYRKLEGTRQLNNIFNYFVRSNILYYGYYNYFQYKYAYNQQPNILPINNIKITQKLYVIKINIEMNTKIGSTQCNLLFLKYFSHKYMDKKPYMKVLKSAIINYVLVVLVNYFIKNIA